LFETREDPISAWIMGKSDAFHLTFLQWHSAEACHQWGIAGFEALGANSAPAIGELAGFLHDPSRSFDAIRCLAPIGHAAEAPVCAALTNESPEIRESAAGRLAWVCDDTAAYLKNFTNCLNDPVPMVRFAAIRGIGAQTNRPDFAIPILIETIQKYDRSISAMAISELAGFGTNAVGTVPLLSHIAMSGNALTRYAALRSLVAIAPVQALPIVLQFYRSGNAHRRSAAIEELRHYSVESLEIQAALEKPKTDNDFGIAHPVKDESIRPAATNELKDIDIPAATAAGIK
jgi:HEAT repeat protein